MKEHSGISWSMGSMIFQALYCKGSEHRRKKFGSKGSKTDDNEAELLSPGSVLKEKPTREGKLRMSVT